MLHYFCRRSKKIIDRRWCWDGIGSSLYTLCKIWHI